MQCAGSPFYDFMAVDACHSALCMPLSSTIVHSVALIPLLTLCRPAVLQQLAAQSLAPTACTTIEEVGSTGVGALTITFLILAVSTVIFITRVGSAASQKVYYYCNVFICGLATMSYFAMLSGQGWTAVAGCRQFFYARYVDWAFTTALIILELGLISGAEPALIGGVMGADGER
eukprot:436707-Hanusia_phi.AAC.5